jgi:hypothetical protein
LIILIPAAGDTGAITCHGGLAVLDPYNPTATLTAFDPTTHTGIIALPACSPNGTFVGVDDELMLGCTPGNNPSDTQTTIISAKTTNSVSVNGITGSDEVYFNAGDNRYYTGSSAMPGGAKLGVVDAETKFLIETIPQSSSSHSVAADSRRNLIFVPQAAVGTDATNVGAGICGGNSGCIAVYKSGADRDDEHEGWEGWHGRWSRCRHSCGTIAGPDLAVPFEFGGRTSRPPSLSGLAISPGAVIRPTKNTATRSRWGT